MTIHSQKQELLFLKRKFLQWLPITAFNSEYVDECWPWMGPIENAGYGVITVKGKKYKAHRVSYSLFNGPIENDELVRHTCDNRWCVNPRHLLKGNHFDNIMDSVKRDRWSGSKLTVEQVKNIKYELKYFPKRGLAAKLAKQYNVNKQTIADIKHGICWKFIEV